MTRVPSGRAGRMARARSRFAPIAAWCLIALTSLTCAVPAAAAAGASAPRELLIMPAPTSTGAAPAAATVLGDIATRVGTRLTLTGTTRTGALRVATDSLSDTDAAGLLVALRQGRDLLWAQWADDAATATKTRAKAAFGPGGQKLLVRIKDGTPGNAESLLARFESLLGTRITPERRIADVWVLKLGEPHSAGQLIDMAAMLQQDPAVEFADPVLRRYAQAVTPNDTLFGQQWNLTDPVSGINAPAAWAFNTGNPSMVIAVVDTGILPHPDLQGRVLPGYDFISDPQRARDGDGRDPNPRDEGDYLSFGDCGGFPPEPSSWHGTRVAGLIAANGNNAMGIAGVDWGAKIVPVRVLGQCGGTDEDVFEGLLWASGASVTGAPLNANPARVINLSLGGFGACTQAIQRAVDAALAQGAVVVAAAGNDTEDASSFSPGNCNGIINVGAHNRYAERTGYSNFGRRVDISAPAGDGGFTDSVISLSNAGATVATDDAYTSGVGTSFSAPLVAGTASLMLARNPTLTPARLLSIMQGTARDFTTGSPCRLSNLCGVGMLDAGLALASTIPATQAIPAGATTVVEYYSPVLDHYFITADANEMNVLDTGSGSFKRTGYVFYAYASLASAPASAKPVCRFYAGPAQLIDSHFFTADAAECAFVQRRWAGIWQLETPAAFYIEVPDAAGNCAAGTLPVYRFFDNRRDANHRYSIDLSVRRAMINRAWTADGPSATGAAFCSPI